MISKIFILHLISMNIVYIFGDFHTPVRLSGGNEPHEGNVEIFIKGEWKYICDDSWDIRDAKVICRALGYTKGKGITKHSHFPIHGNASYWLDDVQCWGSEADITYCWHRGIGNHNCEHKREIAGVICSNVTENDKVVPKPFIPLKKDVELRLVGNAIHGFISTGYLEVYNEGSWGRVCQEKWTNENSFVACGNLGYPGVEEEDVAAKTDVDNDSINLVKNKIINEVVSNNPAVAVHVYGKAKSVNDPQFSNTLYWMKNVKCSGVESTLSECEHAGWEKQQCDRPVYLKCKRSPFLRGNRFDKALLGNHNIRLRAGSKHSEGRVEVTRLGRWGTICDDGWNIINANVVCRQMGFGTAFEAVHYAKFGQGMGKVWLDQVKCNGTEKDIRECSHYKWGHGDCGHPEDAGVKCHFPYGEQVQKMRITGGPSDHLGRVEVYLNKKWQGICGIKFGHREAEVVCRQLGLGYAKRGFSSSLYGLSREKAMFNVRCSGDELALKYCYHNTPEEKESRCRYYEMASVECSETAPDIVMDYRELKKSIRVDSRSLYELSCAYEENCLSSTASRYIHYPHLFSRTLIRFTSRYWNRGTAPFLPYRNKGDWEWHDCHNHYHSMERFSDYDLIDEKGDKKAEGHKASFCLEDSKCENGVKKFFNCTNGGDQGVSVNCADNYKWNIDCQWIDISDLKYGKYRLRVVINPLRNVVESDYSNNVAFCDIDFRNQTHVDVKHCQLENCEQMSHGGTAGGACCKFPFIYKKKQYHACTTDGFGDVLWCSATTNYQKDKLWGKC